MLLTATYRLTSFREENDKQLLTNLSIFTPVVDTILYEREHLYDLLELRMRANRCNDSPHEQQFREYMRV